MPAEPEHFDLAFTAVTQPCPWPKAYGGDLVAQAAAAAMRSVTDGKTLHSMHTYFLRPADIGAPVRYEVELLRDGRGYSTRQVRGYQNGKPRLRRAWPFAAGETGGTFEADRRRGALGRARSSPARRTCPASAGYLERRPARRGGRRHDRAVASLLGRRPQLRHAARSRPGVPHRRGGAGAPPGGLAQALRRAAPP